MKRIWHLFDVESFQLEVLLGSSAHETCYGVDALQLAYACISIWHLLESCLSDFLPMLADNLYSLHLFKGHVTSS